MKKKILYAIIVLLVAIQFVPVTRDNPPADQPLEVSGKEKELLKNACYDCHSNETVWPWYSYVAPISWVVAGHTHNGRKEINFSEWGKYEEGKKDHKLEESIEEVEEGKMPIPGYSVMHEKAELTKEDRDILINFFKAQRKKLNVEETGGFIEEEDHH